MIDLIWDIFQQDQIRGINTKAKIQDAKFDGIEADADRTASRLRELEMRHEQLKLVTLAMWRMLKDHTGLMESDLRRYVENTDLLDGKMDGKVARTKERVPCASCGQTILATAIACPYCGSHQKQTNVFSGA